MDLHCDKSHTLSYGFKEGTGGAAPNISQEEIFQLLFEKALNYPVFSGGALISIAGFLWICVDWIRQFIQKIFQDRYTTSLELTNDNIAYRWVIDHINRHSQWETRNLSVETTLIDNDIGKTRLEHKFIPGVGSHYFYYHNRIVYFERVRDKRDVYVRDGNSHRVDKKRMETVTLSTYGGSPEFWRNFLTEASKACLESMNKGLPIHVAKQDFWEECGEPRRKRPLDSVILAPGVSEKIFTDVETFLASADWYHARGIPYRRGYLLYGPPGTGKTSFIGALASHFGYGVAILSLTNKFMTDLELQSLMNDAPNKCIIIMEDIDVAFKNREEPKKVSSDGTPNTVDSTITLSGLLNAIDGVASAEERIIFMTTNYKDNLDSALIRPGRIDFQAYLGHCVPEMVAKMFRRFYDDISEETVDKFVEATSKLEKSFSPAELQKHLIIYKNNPQTAIDNVYDLIRGSTTSEEPPAPPKVFSSRWRTRGRGR